MFDNATIGYFLLLQLITPLPKKNMKPLVNNLSETLRTQSTSVYPCACNWLLVIKKNPHYEACFIYLSMCFIASKCGFHGVCMNLLTTPIA